MYQSITYNSKTRDRLPVNLRKFFPARVRICLYLRDRSVYSSTLEMVGYESTYFLGCTVL